MYEKLLTNKKFLWCILLFFCLIISIPLYTKNLMIGHDTLFHVTRIESIFHGIEAGNFPIKLYGYIFNDYGNPVGYFYPDLFLYIPVFFRLIGFDVTFSYHLFLFLITLFTAILSWFSFTALFKHINKNSKTPDYLFGFAASILYTGSLYRFSDLYVRGAIGETLAMIFFPMALIFFYLMLQGEKSAWIFVVIASTGVLESHILSSFLLFLSYVFLSLVFFKSFFNRDVLKSILKATVFVILLNLWFYAPFVDMYNSFDFYMKSWVRPASSVKIFSWTDLFHYQFFLGIISVAILFLYFFCALIKSRKKTDNLDKIFIKCFLLCVFFMFMITPAMPWTVFDNIPLLGERLGALQFAYRITIFTTFFLSIALSIALFNAKTKNYRFLFLTLVIPFVSLFWMINMPFTPENGMLSIFTKDNSTAADRIQSLKGTDIGNFLISEFDMPHNSNIVLRDYIYNDIEEKEYKAYIDEASPEYWEAVKNKTLITLDPYEICPKEIISDFSRQNLNLNFKTKAQEETNIKLPLWYYPHSWRATSDGKEIPVFETDKHRVTINAPAGEHFITVEPKLRTPYRNAYFISFIGFLLFLYFCFARRKEFGDKHNGNM